MLILIYWKNVLSISTSLLTKLLVPPLFINATLFNQNNHGRQIKLCKEVKYSTDFKTKT